MENRFWFRAKRIDNGEWVEGLLTIIWGQYHIINPDNENTAYPTYESTICQCTGLRDKKGKLIWENDIVDGHIKRGAAFLNCLVLWNECKARFDVRAIDCNFPMTLDEVVDDISICGLDYEVIGNRFDNPELLEV